MVAPFWDDVDLSQNGQVNYFVNNKSDSTHVINEINRFLSTHLGSNFNADWILAVKWENVCHIRDNNCPVNEVCCIIFLLNIFNYHCCITTYSQIAFKLFWQHKTMYRMQSIHINVMNSIGNIMIL